MSVVIRGIDKPRDCDYCHFQTDSYCRVLLSYINVEHGVDTRCPIIEINEYTMKNGHKVVVADTPQTEHSACDTCQWYNSGIPCGVEPSVCKREVTDTPQCDSCEHKHEMGLPCYHCPIAVDCGWRKPE